MGIYYTNQTIEAFNQMNEQGILVGKEAFVWEELLPSYHWMIRQMDKRINHDSSYPIWLWTDKPNLHDEAHFEKGTNAVCLTVEVADDKLLLSDFDAWHCVLNNNFCSMTEEEYELFNRGERTITKEQSWERIFEIEELQKSDMWITSDPIVQGVTSAIRKEQIINVEHFIAK